MLTAHIIASFTTLFLIFEGIQIKSNAAAYFIEIWNYLDLSRIAAGYGYCFIIYSGQGTEYEASTLATLNLLAYLRCLGLLRLFS